MYEDYPAIKQQRNWLFAITLVSLLVSIVSGILQDAANDIIKIASLYKSFRITVSQRIWYLKGNNYL